MTNISITVNTNSLNLILVITKAKTGRRGSAVDFTYRTLISKFFFIEILHSYANIAAKPAFSLASKSVRYKKFLLTLMKIIVINVC